MDVSKILCDGESKLFLEIKVGCEVSHVKTFFLVNLLGSQYLFQILQTSLTAKNSGKVVQMFQKALAIE